MQQLEVISILKKDLNFNDRSIEKVKKFVELILNENKNHNLIAKSTESSIWDRHILDSAQLVKFIDFKLTSLADLGSGAGFPGLIIEIFNKNKDFHVKLYEKSPVKRQFLSKVIKELDLNAEIYLPKLILNLTINMYFEACTQNELVCKLKPVIKENIKYSC